MRKLTIEAEKLLAEHKIGPYHVKLRVMSYELPNGTPLYELAIWNKWHLSSVSKWTTWEDALREFEHAKRGVAVSLAEAVLFNEAKQPEDQ